MGDQDNHDRSTCDQCLRDDLETAQERIAALEAELAAAQARADKLDYAFGLSEKATRQATEIAAATQAVIAQKNEALDRLAKLGNGDRYGNSEGNRIAQEALDIPSGRSCLDAMLAEAKLAEAAKIVRGIVASVLDELDEPDRVRKAVVRLMEKSIRQAAERGEK